METLIEQLGLDHIRQNRGYALSAASAGAWKCAVPLHQSHVHFAGRTIFGFDPIAVLDLQRIISDLKASVSEWLITDHQCP